MKRPLLYVLVGYILGIIWGYIFKINIAPFCFIFLIFYFIISKLKYPYKKIMKIIFNKKIVIIICVVSIISNTYIILKNEK